ncbi:hypothetical protein PAXRUDRAFT_170675, partial [Paxillus rubicundulus Ve08.2h10]
IVVPRVECFVNGEEFFVMDVIVELQSGVGLGVEHDWAEFVIWAADGKDAGDSIVRGVSLNNDRGIRHPMSQDWSRGEGIFQTLESGQNNDVGMIIDETVVEVGEAEEGRDVLNFPRFWPIGNGFDFAGRHDKNYNRGVIAQTTRD